MDKNKSEKLKEILNQTLSTEDIEKKLKEKIKEQKNVEKSTEKIKTEKIKTVNENLLKNEKIIPNVKEKKKETQGLNILLYLVLTITILLLSIVIYLFTKNNDKIDYNISSKPIKEKKLDVNNLILTSNDKKEKEEEISFPLEKEKEKENVVLQEKELETNSSINNKKNIGDIEGKPKEIIKIKEVIKEKIVTKTIKLEKKNFKEYYNSSKYNSLKCYDFIAGDIFPPSQCKSDLKKFLLANKNAIRFEVIPVIAEDDNKVFKKMESEIKNMDKDFQSKVKEYMFKGLSRERVLETSWNIKDILGEDTILTPTNYYVKSKKNNKGVIIKAYH